MSKDPLNYLTKLLPIVYSLIGITLFSGIATIYLLYFSDPSGASVNSKEIGVAGKEERNPAFTDFIEGEGMQLVVSNCTGCHSAKLVTQNRATREGWLSMIQWMQKTQNLWDLGENEAPILDYLAKYYAPEKEGRRRNLTNIKWYQLKQ